MLASAHRFCGRPLFMTIDSKLQSKLKEIFSDVNINITVLTGEGISITSASVARWVKEFGGYHSSQTIYIAPIPVSGWKLESGLEVNPQFTVAPEGRFDLSLAAHEFRVFALAHFF